MGLVKKFNDFAKLYEKKHAPIEVIDNDFTLDGKIKNLLFQQGIGDIDGLVTYLKRQGVEVESRNSEAIYKFIKGMVREYISDECIVKINDEIQDSKKILDACVELISDLHTNQIIDDLFKLPI